jgi:hypothetical protein
MVAHPRLHAGKPVVVIDVVARLVDLDQHMHIRAGIPVEAVPLVGRDPFRRGKHVRGWMAPVLDNEPAFLCGGMPKELCAQLAIVPRPIVLGIGSRVDGDEPLAAFHKRLDRRLLLWCEDVLGGHQEDDDIKVSEEVRSDERRVFSRRDAPFGLLRNLHQGLDCRWNHLVSVAGRFGDHEEVDPWTWSWGRRVGRKNGAE